MGAHEGRRRRRRWLVALALLLVSFAVATVALFTIPHHRIPAHADAVVVIGGSGPRAQLGLALARRGVAPELVISGYPYCAQKVRHMVPIPGVHISCVHPTPYSTQGEARYVAAEARRLHWRSIILITSTDQSTRARIRFGRCTDVPVSYVTVPLPAGDWPYAIVYEWGALAKALIWQRAC